MMKEQVTFCELHVGERFTLEEVTSTVYRVTEPKRYGVYVCNCIDPQDIPFGVDWERKVWRVVGEE